MPHFKNELRTNSLLSLLPFTLLPLSTHNINKKDQYLQLFLSLLVIGVFKEKGGVPGRQYMEPLIHQCTGGLSHHYPHYLLFIIVIIVIIIIIVIIVIIWHQQLSQPGAQLHQLVPLHRKPEINIFEIGEDNLR